jgi:hypothetical protein
MPAVIRESQTCWGKNEANESASGSDERIHVNALTVNGGDHA